MSSSQLRVRYLSLYKQYLKLSKKVPRPMRNKFLWNVRETYEWLKTSNISNEKRLELLQQGEENLITLKKIFSLPEDQLSILNKSSYSEELYKTSSDE